MRSQRLEIMLVPQKSAIMSEEHVIRMNGAVYVY
jgi:hypothetical protein